MDLINQFIKLQLHLFVSGYLFRQNKSFPMLPIADR